MQCVLSSLHTLITSCVGVCDEYVILSCLGDEYCVRGVHFDHILCVMNVLFYHVRGVVLCVCAVIVAHFEHVCVCVRDCRV